jgi:hypothetical protein
MTDEQITLIIAHLNQRIAALDKAFMRAPEGSFAERGALVCWRRARQTLRAVQGGTATKRQLTYWLMH